MPTLSFAAIALLSALAQQQSRATERVDLAGLASIELPSEFKAVGRGQDGPRTGHFDPATLDRHRNDYQITFRFEQGQRVLPSGKLANPVLLHVTLFNPAKPKPDATRIGFTTISQFYPPAGNDRPRLDAHFGAQRWLDDEMTGDAVTRSAATNEGRGDSVASGPPERWLVIHVDPTRRIRIDLYAWRSTYSLDAARALVRRAAESVQTTPKLAELFGGVDDAEAREDARFEATVHSALAALSQCGIRSMGPGMVAWSDRCASWLSDDRRFLRVARALGRIPLTAAGHSQGGPEFVVAMPAGRSSKLPGPLDFRMAQLFWHDAAKGWAIAGFGEHRHDDDAPDAPLITSITPHLRDRTSVHLIALASYDLQLSPDPVAIAEFLAEADRVATALREGKVVPGVRAKPFVFEP
ncbi:MAG: hypothetical protein ACJ79A_17480 [Gemmatimonadaceae bacterium]